MKTKLLIAILAGVMALVGVGYYFVKENEIAKDDRKERRKAMFEKSNIIIKPMSEYQK